MKKDNEIKMTMDNEIKVLSITVRELEIISLLIDEYSSKEIAQKLFISIETVHSHRKNIRRKLGVKNVAGIVREAIHLRMVS